MENVWHGILGNTCVGWIFLGLFVSPPLVYHRFVTSSTHARKPHVRRETRKQETGWGFRKQKNGVHMTYDSNKMSSTAAATLNHTKHQVYDSHDGQYSSLCSSSGGRHGKSSTNQPQADYPSLTMILYPCTNESSMMAGGYDTMLLPLTTVSIPYHYLCMCERMNDCGQADTMRC